MNFKGHAIGAGIASLTYTGLVYRYEGIHTLDNPNYFVVAGLTAFFALFPDLDTKSTPQKWFFRSLFILNAAMIYCGMFEVCAYISTVCMIPLMDKHRGITHSFLLSLLLPLLIICSVEKLIFGVDIQVKSLIMSYTWYYLGCVIGWWTHLVLNSSLIKK